MNRLLFLSLLMLSSAFSKDGFKTLFLDGTWDGATVTGHCSPDQKTTWIPIRNNAEWTDSGVDNFYANEGVWFKLTITGAGGSTNLNAWIN